MSAALRTPTPAPTADLVERLAADVARSILRGERAPGTRLPSVRSLASEWDVNVSTVQRVLARLEADRLVQAQPRVGTIVLDPATHGGARLWPYLLDDESNKDAALMLLRDALRSRRVLALSVMEDLLALPAADYRQALLDAVERFAATVDADPSPASVCAAESEIYRLLLRLTGRPAVLAFLNDVESMLQSSPRLVRAFFSDPKMNIVGLRQLAAAAQSDALVSQPKLALEGLNTLMEAADRRAIMAFEALLFTPSAQP